MYNQLLSDCLVILIFKMSLSFTSFTQIMITVHLKKPFNLFEAIINPDRLNFYEFDCLDKYYGKSIIVFKGTVQEK